MMKKRIIILIIVLALILSVACSQNPQKKEMVKGTKESSIFQEGDIKTVKITTSKANVRPGFSTKFPVMFTPTRNQRLNVVGKMGNWYVVRLPDNRLGAIDQKEAKPIVDEKDTPKENRTTEDRNKEERNDYSLTSLEQEMVNLVNKARKDNNLPPLKVDPEVTKVARIKSQDMVENDYFSHHSPTYGSPFDMLKKFGISYTAAGENIAANTSVQRAHNALMRSEGHRKNILNPNFTHIGIGIKRGGPSDYIFTQLFIGR